MSIGIISAHEVLAAGGGAGSATIQAKAAELAAGPSVAVPTDGGAFTLAGSPVGALDYTVKDGPITVSAFTAADWFTTRADVASAFCIVRGDLTINAGQTFIPPARKLFTVLYVTGNLTINGSVSMTARGANHSGATESGGYTAPVNLPITASVSIPALGGAKGVGGNGNGAAGAAGATGGSGGGGGGGGRFGTGGDGAQGTCFSGGAAGGGTRDGVGGAAGANGGWGGIGVGNATYVACSGAGNPSRVGTRSRAGQDGTGGTLIVICLGTLSGSGTIVSGGSAGASQTVQEWDSTAGGGGSGGGSVTVLRAVAGGTTPAASAPGGTGGGQTAPYGGGGGPGSVRVAAI